ncbi:uncharacterized protein N7511_003545 [Penicillium nucicola]|uniref:uncharacterized protein n=1 Tax=Penicillium nucicola TaxID=1850975 RepID=UPI002544FBBB|nr:uncharacterized protein N7511_003545 [Penicillium nucicola]KAJ5771494.1 hypothetical protein N7511_003545 [Penicillium nucicola]
MNKLNQNGLLDDDFDLDLHAIWRESSCIPAPPPCLCADHENPELDFQNELNSISYKGQGSPQVEYLFHPNNDNQPGFKWTGPDLLSFSTQPEDLFLHMSAFFIFEELYWLELSLAKIHQFSGETVGEYLFFLPRVETAMGNLRRVRGQILDIISLATDETFSPTFTLSLWPRTEALPYSSHSTISPQATLPTMPSLDPSFFVHNIQENYK